MMLGSLGWTVMRASNISIGSASDEMYGGLPVEQRQSAAGFFGLRESAVVNFFRSGIVFFDEEQCTRSIHDAVNHATSSSSHDFSLSLQQREHVIDSIAAAAVKQMKGDWVETDGSTESDGCGMMGEATLLAAIAQRAALREPICNGYQHGYDENDKHRQNERMQVPKRAAWLAFENDGCVDEVKQLFTDHRLYIADEIRRNEVFSSSMDVPIYLLKGSFVSVLPDSQVGDIAVLKLNGGGGGNGSTQALYESTLNALFAFYRRVVTNGYIFIGQYDTASCRKAIDEFFVDGNYTMSAVDTSTRSFTKTNDKVRVPPDYRNTVIKKSLDPIVLAGWATLKEWHRDTVKQFVGNVGDNLYQSYRYIEAMRHVVQRIKEDASSRDGSKAARVNVCETGYNGGHSAQLFLSFLNRGDNVDVHYYGWDLKQFGSSEPTAEKMKEVYGDNFHIVWGDSKQTLQHAREDMNGQRCHLIVIDGEHSKNGVLNDIENFLKVAEPGCVIFGDDCAPYKRTVPESEQMLEAWMEFVDSGRLISVAKYRNPELGSPGFVEGVVRSVE
jgi:hypothetical protein